MSIRRDWSRWHDGDVWFLVWLAFWIDVSVVGWRSTNDGEWLFAVIIFSIAFVALLLMSLFGDGLVG